MKNGQNDVIRALFFQGPFLSTNQGKKKDLLKIKIFGTKWIGIVTAFYKNKNQWKSAEKTTLSAFYVILSKIEAAGRHTVCLMVLLLWPAMTCQKFGIRKI